MPYEKQLEWKQSKADRMLSKFCKVNQILDMEIPYNYRNKVQTAFRLNQRKQLVSGVYQSSSGNLAVTNDCMLENERCTAVVQTIKKLMISFKLPPYDFRSGSGLVRHVLTRYSQTTGQLMVCIVTSSPLFPSKNNFVSALIKAHPEIKTIVQNICTNPMQLTLGERQNVLYGKGYIEDILCGKKFRISPSSFYQVNSVQTEKLYKLAINAACISKNDTVIDAYCGTGTIGILCADKAKEVIGAELNVSACRDAVINAKINNLDNISFVNADAGDFMQRLAQQGKPADVVIMDPPRAGSDRRFLESLAKMSPSKVVYISCKIETLERDLKLLRKLGYKAKFIQPVDMFPHTTGIETVVLLSKLKSTHHIEVELKTDELDLTSVESKATYDEIKAYVKEHTGLTVSSLNIAQVKQKCGIIERENYNKAKSKDSRQPKCPMEKEEAIRNALKYFRMV